LSRVVVLPANDERAKEITIAAMKAVVGTKRV